MAADRTRRLAVLILAPQEVGTFFALRWGQWPQPLPPLTGQLGPDTVVVQTRDHTLPTPTVHLLLASSRFPPVPLDEDPPALLVDRSSSPARIWHPDDSADRPVFDLPESGGVAPQAPAGPDRGRLLTLGADLLAALGVDPTDPNVADTPRRWADAWCEFLAYDPGRTDTAFASTETDQLVVVSGIRLWSICAHHLLPFWCDVAIGYIPEGQVLGLSKFARIAQQMAHRLQLQERLAQEIADAVLLAARTDSVAVLARGVHLCMSMRGVRTPALMTSSVTRGGFRTDARLRAEFLTLAGPPPAAS